MVVRSYSSDQLHHAILNSTNWNEVMRQLDVVASGKTSAAIKRQAKRLGFDCSHLRYKAEGFPATKKSLDEYLVLGGKFSSSKLRQRLIIEGYKEVRCERCQLVEWEGEAIPLQLDHINGDRHDNRLENLAVLCPNCHALTDTFGVRNRTFNRKFYYCECGQQICGRQAKKCRSCAALAQEKIIWPSKEELEKLVWEIPTSKLSRQIGVSDKAIDKRCKKLGIDKPPRGYWSK